MTKQEFEQLTAQGTVLLDGALGTNLSKAGMPKGVCTEVWAMEHPDVLMELQKAYVAAGTQILYAPTFAANRISLAKFSMSDRVQEINTKLVQITKESAQGKAYVAGDITTVGRMLEPRGDLSYEEMLDAYKEQIQVLVNADVDLLVAETMLCVDEMMVALDAAQSVCDLPMMLTMTVEADGSAFFGGNVVEAVETLQEMGAAAVGINCSLGPDQMEAVVGSMRRVAHIPIIAKPNAGLPTIDEKGQAIYSMDAETFGENMKVLTAAGAGIIGGCCGTDPSYIKALAANVRRSAK